MDSSLNFLDSQGDFETVDLAKATQRALQVILPWCHIQNTSAVPFTRDIAKQALVYAKAIDHSVAAAQYGFAVAEDAISLVELIPESTPEQQRNFLIGMQLFATKGRDNANQAHRQFCNVRVTVETLVKSMKYEADACVEYTEYIDDKLTPVKRPCFEMQSELVRGIHDLEEFSGLLSKFVAWWNLMSMESTTQMTRGSSVIARFDSLRMLSIEKKWKDHRKRYATYVDEIVLVQDHYPKLFAHSRSITFEGDEPFSPPPNQPPSYSRRQDQSQGVRQQQSFGTMNVFTEPASYVGYNPPDGRPQIIPGRATTGDKSYVILSEDLSSSSYISASVGSVQILEEKKCLLMLHFQCHPSSTRRFDSLAIKCKFLPIRGMGGALPRVVDVAPKQSIGGKSQERHNIRMGVKAVVQASAGPVVIGPEINTEREITKTVSRAMFITGSARGRQRDGAEWTLTENSGVGGGIPAHFCVAMIVDYDGVFMLELDVVVTQYGTRKWWRSKNYARDQLAIDVDKIHGDFQEYKPSAAWRRWFPLISGEVAGGTTIYPQDAYTR